MDPTTPSPSLAVPDVGAAVHALKPGLKRFSTYALVAMVVILAATVAAILASLNMLPSDRDRFKYAMVAPILGGLLIHFTYKRMRRAQEALVMPVVAQAVDLTYSKDAKAFLQALPPRLLPRASVRLAEDLVEGRLGNHSIRMAEVEIATGGKNSRTLFKGVVAAFRNSIAMPAFFVAPHAQTTPGMIFRAWIPTDGLYHARDVQGPSGTRFGVWTSWSGDAEPPALQAIVGLLTRLDERLGGQMALFTATSDGEVMHLALTHRRNLFRIGGLFVSDEQLFSDVFAAVRDLSLPLKLVQELIEAEKIASEEVKGA